MFSIMKEIVTNHGSHFQKKMIYELTSKLGFKQEQFPPYYPQVNGQVESVNNSLKNILQQMVNLTKSNWNLML
jgi:transposase InsO family protein